MTIISRSPAGCAGRFTGIADRTGLRREDLPDASLGKTLECSVSNYDVGSRMRPALAVGGPVPCADKCSVVMSVGVPR